MAEETSSPTTINRADALGMISQSVTLVLGAIGGLAGGAIRVWEDFYNDWKCKPGFSKLREDRFKEQNTLRQQFERRTDLTGWEKTQTLQKELDTIEKKYMDKFGARLEQETGVVSKGFFGRIKGTAQRIALTKPEKRGTAFFTAGVSALVTMGAVLAVSPNTWEKLFAGTKNNDRSVA